MNINVGKVFVHNRKSVTTTASQLESDGTELRYGIQMLSETGNNSIIYIGTNSGVSSGDGFPLDSSGSLFLPIDDTSSIWMIAGSGTQHLRYIGG